MSKRAEEAASKAYPLDKPHLICKDCQRILQEVYQEGYEQAEKDLELTWEEIADIVILADTVLDSHEEEWKKLGPEAYYSAVLRAYKDAKG